MTFKQQVETRHGAFADRYARNVREKIAIAHRDGVAISDLIDAIADSVRLAVLDGALRELEMNDK